MGEAVTGNTEQNWKERERKIHGLNRQEWVNEWNIETTQGKRKGGARKENIIDYSKLWESCQLVRERMKWKKEIPFAYLSSVLSNALTITHFSNQKWTDSLQKLPTPPPQPPWGWTMLGRQFDTAQCWSIPPIYVIKNQS